MILKTEDNHNGRELDDVLKEVITDLKTRNRYMDTSTFPLKGRIIENNKALIKSIEKILELNDTINSNVVSDFNTGILNT